MTSSKRSLSSRFAESVLDGGARGAALLAGGFCLLVAGFLVVESWPVLGPGAADLVGGAAWHPREGEYGLLPMVAGSIAVTAGALSMAIPLGLLVSIFLHFYAPPPLARGYRRMLGVLAGIPSVVYGLWGLSVVVPLVRRLGPPGPSLLSASVVLGLMVLPTLALFADAAFARLPRATREGAAALALSRPTFVVAVALPASRSGLAAATVLAAARALGETMAVLMVAGNVVQMPTGILDPVRTLTANVALEMAYAMDAHRAALFASGLVLLALAAALALATEALVGRRKAHAPG